MDENLMDGAMGAAVEAVTVAMAGAFDEIWSKPTALQTMAEFLDGKIRFVIERDGVTVVKTSDGPTPEPPPTGMYL